MHRNSTKWVPASAPNLVIPTELTLTSKVYTDSGNIHYKFSLKAADRVVIYIEPHSNNKVVDWSFNKVLLDEGYEAPYFAYHVYSMDDTPFEFWIEIEV